MRKFLVVLDDSRECLNAIRYAALRAAHTGGGVQILSIVPPEEFQHWIGVAAGMGRPQRRIADGVQAFAAVIEHHQKLAHPRLPGLLAPRWDHGRNRCCGASPVAVGNSIDGEG